MSKEVQSQASEMDALTSGVEGTTLKDDEKRRLRLEARRITKKTSQTLRTFGETSALSTPEFRAHMQRQSQALARYVPLYLGLNNGIDERELQKDLQTMYDAMDETYASLRGFQKSFESIPRLTRDLSRARRQAEKEAQDLVTAFRSAILGMEAVLDLFPPSPKSLTG